MAVDIQAESPDFGDTNEKMLSPIKPQHSLPNGEKKKSKETNMNKEATSASSIQVLTKL